MSRHALRHQLEINALLLKASLAGLSDEELGQAPVPEVASLRWLLGHLCMARGGMLVHLGGEALLNDMERTAFARGTDGRPDEGPDAADLKGRLVGSTSTLDERLENASANLLDGPAPAQPKLPLPARTLSDFVAFLLVHETYHLGQIGLLRKALGHKGAI